MPAYSQKVALGVCDRCSCQLPVREMVNDSNYKGLRVCRECCDQKNPWLLRPCSPDTITVQYPRPETPINFGITPQFLKWDSQGEQWDQSGLTWDETIGGGS